MATYMEIGGIPNFDCHGDSSAISQRWRKWKRAFELFVVGKGITDLTQKRALLLHCAGMRVQEIFDTLADTGEDTDYDKAVQKLGEYFAPQGNISFERHQFRQLKQESSESVEQFITRLRDKAMTCEFGDGKDDQIRDQVIDKCKSTHLRKKFLEKGGTLTLTKMLEMGRAHEAAERQAAVMQEETVHAVYEKRKGHKPGYQGADRFNTSSQGNKSQACFRCGRQGHYSKDKECPARNKKCNKCHKMGHFQKCCKTKGGNPGNGRSQERTVKYVQDQDSVELTDYVFSVVKEPVGEQVSVIVGGVPISFTVDSGAGVNMIDRELWESLKKSKINCVSNNTDKKLFAYGSTKPLPLAGCFEADVILGNKMVPRVMFYVLEGTGQPLLGKMTAIELGVLHVGTGHINSVEHDISKAELMKKYPECFTGIGKLKDYQMTIALDDTVTPVIQPLRRIPYHLRDRLESKIHELESLDIIEKVEEPSAWVSPVVIIPKSNGDIRLCVDMRRANEAVIRERYPIPTVDEILQDLNQSKVFSKLDIRWAYHQIELAPESRGITTFQTHLGMYRYKRLMFGISCAPELYNKIIQQVLRECPGVNSIFDDIVVHGETQGEHNKNLDKLLQTLREKGLTLNLDKCQFNMSQITFMGHVLSEHGISLDEDKVKAVVNARQPSNAGEVRSFLGLVNFSSRFLPNLATVSEPLRQLTRKDAPFNWGPTQEQSFKKLKTMLSNACVLGYFDPKAKTQVIADASPVGLGGVLVQEQDNHTRVICYASRSLTDIERKYSQTEKEALGLVWACERFHMYLYGQEFELVTDHKPLQFIFSQKSKPCARVERWILRLQSYTYTVKYIPGSQNIADYPATK
ncbi:uncharacterized protein K02A2.6-like [Mizuhopecten yessoensis]|uniref:uncharacterized protein K02A2.6-like n=1 Tax=Mizuhopecten yessoensis TaxID=6573 RepID=UPI000B45AF27|nr:uncharacterized protein K02A2.6-like [Mizuhopecten yessoensis]